MTLNSSGPISLGGATTGQSIALELGQSATGQISLNDTNVRTLAGVSSGAIVMPLNFWGKSTYDYFMASVSYSTDIAAATLSVDSSGNSILFGQLGNDALALAIGSTGLLTVSKQVSPTGDYSLLGVADNSGNYYAFTSQDSFGCPYAFTPQAYKFNSSLSVITSKTIDLITFVSVVPPIVDVFGNIWSIFADWIYYDYYKLVRFNSSLTPQDMYYGYTLGQFYELTSIVSDSAGYIITGGYLAQYNCCACYTSPVGLFVTKLPASNLNATPAWSKEFSYPTLNLISKIAVDASDNVYVAAVIYFSAVVIFKFNSSGNLQWQTSLNWNAVNLTGIAFDSSGYVYCYGANLSNNGVTIVKLHPTSALIQYSRNLTIETGFIFSAEAKIVSNKLYLNGPYSNGVITNTFLIKLPVDGSLTQTFTLNGSSFTYSAGSITQTTSGYDVSTNYIRNFTVDSLPTTSAATTTASTISPTSSRVSL